jgi:ribosomal protein S27AE
METPTIKPFTESAQCTKCGAADYLAMGQPMPSNLMMNPVIMRFCPGGKELEEEEPKNPIEAFLSLLPALGSSMAVARKPRINICAGIGEEHLHKTCPRCGFEWLTAVRS